MDHKEKRFESDIETYLLAEGGYTKGTMATYDKARAIDLHTLIKFIAASQETEWKAYQKTYSQDPSTQLYTRLSEEISKKGLIHVLRNGISDRGHRLKICYFKPESNLNPQILKKYNDNLLTCTRQFYYSPNNRNSIDMVLSLNGIPIVAIELKNQHTGQSVVNAKSQFMHDRDPRELCFNANTRFLVYFAVDLYEIAMTTKLAGKDTIFLPFNQGSGGAGEVGGAGNPENPNGYATSYLWEKILKKDSLLSILQHFIHADQKTTIRMGRDTNSKKTNSIIFPRYHQWDVVNKILADVRDIGSGKNYLIQHSAGSGKSNSLAWLSYRLASLHQNDKAIFTSVIVVTDRRVLDRQLQSTIQSFDHVEGFVETISEGCTAQDLKQAIVDGKKIIVTTLQKFPMVHKELAGMQGRKFAIIVDEAHSSQSGSSAAAVKIALADTQKALAEFAEKEGIAEADVDTEDVITKSILTHGKHQNLSFFAFTATPKEKTLEIFGIPQTNGQFIPFHIYSMRQAIDEGFIHDVLLNYKTYKVCYQLAKSAVDNPELPESAAVKAIRRYETFHPYNLEQKIEVMVEYVKHVTAKKINGKAKAMLVASSRLHAIRYFQGFKSYIAKNGYTDLDVMVAFSGKVKDGDVEYTESALNQTKSGQRISENQLPEYFKSDDFNLLIVAEKYQTGFDEPLLHTMFVDKKLGGVKAVQTLSRLNRTTVGKVDTAVIDFVNSADDIKEAFAPYFDSTSLSEEFNANFVYSAKDIIRNYGFYNNLDITKFNAIYSQKTQTPTALGRITSLLTPIQNNFLGLDTDHRAKFKKSLRNFVRAYQYVTQIVRMFDVELEKEYNFLRYLEKILPAHESEKVDLDDKIRMEYYKLDKTFEGKISLDSEPLEDKGILSHSISESTGAKDPKKQLLDTIIDRINTEFVGLISEMDRVIISTLYDRTINNRKLQKKAKDTEFLMFFETAFKKAFEDASVACYAEQMTTFEKLFQNKIFNQAVMDQLGRETYNTLRNRT